MIGFVSSAPASRVSFVPTHTASSSCAYRTVVSSQSKRQSSRLLRMQDSDSESMPSDTFSFSSVAEKLNIGDAKIRSEAYSKILRIAATTNRGRLATPKQIADMEDLILQLEAVNPNVHPMESEAMNGVWKLIFFAKTSSINKDILDPFLKSQKLLEFGEITQTIDVDDGTLVQSADFIGFPGITGTVTTTARIIPVGPERMEVKVEESKIKGNELLDRIDVSKLEAVLPIDTIFQRVRGKSAETYIDTYYLDDMMRISRDKKGNLYVFIKDS